MKWLLTKKDIGFIAVVLTAALFLFLLRSRGGADKVGHIDIYLADELYERVELGTEKIVAIRQADGSENIIRITQEGAYMQSATCHNQDCLHQGEITAQNIAQRPLRNWIICLPNRVSVELILSGGE